MSDDNCIQKCIVLQRDEYGFGLTVAGHSPTYVQLVKENGAASRAGIQKGDKIIKVNGTLVTHCNHAEVNDILRFGSYVNLTLLGRLPPVGSQVMSIRTLDDLKERKDGASSPTHTDKETDISSPKAVDATKASQYLMQKVMTMKIMQQQVQKEYENMQEEYERSPSEQLLVRLEVKKQMVNRVDEQLKAVQDLEGPPKRPFSAGHETWSEQISGVKMNTQMSVAAPLTTIPATTRHKKSDSMPETFYKISDLKRYTTLSESKAVEAVVEEGDANALEGRSKDQSSTSDSGKGRSSADQSESKQSPNSLSASPHQAWSIGSMIRKTRLKVVLPSQVKVATIDESIFSTIEDPVIFIDLEQLKLHPAHLSVFLHYIMPNFDPSPMLFHIVTESYPLGSNKEMRKWSYEIYSTFLNDRSPLKVNVDDEIVMKVETILQSKHDSDDLMRNVFVPARAAAANEILDQLADFRARRASGLGSIYGDQELKDNMDKSTELKVIENGLWKYFEMLITNRSNDRCKALASALATFFKWVGLSSSKISSSLERCYTFNAKDKKTFKFKTNKKLINGHQYIAQQYYVPTYCYRCHSLFWGIGHQGFQCSHCDINLHKNCVEIFKEPCSVNTLKKRKDKKGSSVFDKIISRKISVNNPIAIREAQHIHEALPFSTTPTFVAGFSTPSIHTTVPVVNGDNEDTEHSKSKRSSSQEPQPNYGCKVQDDSFEVLTDLLSPCDTADSSASVSRSDSLQGYLDAKVNVRRAHSDVTPENQPNQPQLSDSSGCSSNSSLSAKSSELLGSQHPQEGEASYVTSALATPLTTVTNQQMPPSHPHQHHSFSNFSYTQHPQQHHQYQQQQQQQQQQQHPFISYSLSSLVMQPQQLQLRQQQAGALGHVSDSDFEVDPELPCMESYIPKEQLRKLKPKERKRQEVINELFHTEQAHVRNLKVMQRLFYVPMVEDQSIARDFISLIFPNLQELIECHCTLNEEFKAKRAEDAIVGNFASILERQFSGMEGEKSKVAAATFCENQSHCLEVLKVKQKKDAKFAAFLQEAASNPLCRRLELKDLIPTEMQRLTKYPLLIENLLKYTQTNTEEYESLHRSLDQSKSILSYVDQRVKECENLQKLSDLQRRLDTKPIENSAHPVLAEYKKLDLRRHKMIYDGPLTWRICRSKQLEMHAVLLEDILVLLQKSQDSERLVLRCQSSNLSITGGQGGVGGVGGGRDDKQTHSPIIKLTNLLLRNVATDKKAFFLVSISEFGPQIYEFVAATKDEKNRWFKYISDAAEAYKYRKGFIDKPPTLTATSSYLSSPNVVTSGGQEVETVQPSGALALLSSSISSIIPDDIDHLKVAKIDPSFHHHQSQMDPSHYHLRSRSRSSDSDDHSDSREGISDDNLATVTLVESDGAGDHCLVQPNQVKVSTFQILEKQISIPYTDVVRDTNKVLERVLMEKKKLVAELLDIPVEEYDTFAQIAEEEAGNSNDVRELLLAMLTQTDHLVEIVSNSANRNVKAIECTNTEISRTTPATTTSVEATSSFVASTTSTTVATSPMNVSATIPDKMVVVSSTEILGVSSKLNQYLLQLMEVLVQQENIQEKTTHESTPQPPQTVDHLTPHSNIQGQNANDPEGSDLQPQMPDPVLTRATPATTINTTSITTTMNENNYVTTLEATIVDSPEFETGHVLTTSVSPLFCGAPPYHSSPSSSSLSSSSSSHTIVAASPTPPSSSSTASLPQIGPYNNSSDNNSNNNDNNNNYNNYNNCNSSSGYASMPSTMLYTSSIRFPRFASSPQHSQPQRSPTNESSRSGVPGGDEDTLTVL